jgi:hypothetical protein
MKRGRDDWPIESIEHNTKNINTLIGLDESDLDDRMSAWSNVAERLRIAARKLFPSRSQGFVGFRSASTPWSSNKVPKPFEGAHIFDLGP